MKNVPLRRAPLFIAITILAVASLALAVARTKSFFGGRSDPSMNSARSRYAPRIVLWAWERPTDLRFIDPNQIRVAFLAKSIRLKSDQVVVRPRLQSLRLPESTKVIAVVRIETDREALAQLSGNQLDKTARAIADLCSLPNISEIQIDFDATQSERSFYRELLNDVRHRLPANVRLSITALASWCMSDDWISDLPIDEAVPMLFRMAADGKHIASRLDAGEDFNAAPCRQSYGISLDEPRPKLIPSRRLYVFNPDAWTEKSVREILESSK